MTPLGKYMYASPPATFDGKTKIWRIHARDDFVLGTVKWKSSWRCYVFEPAAETCFNSTCLTELDMFLSAETTKQLHPTRVRGELNLGAEVRKLGLTGKGEGLY